MVRLNERGGAAIRARSLLLPRPPSPLRPMYGEAAEDALKNRQLPWRGQTPGVKLLHVAAGRRPALGAHACGQESPREITVLRELCWGNGCPTAAALWPPQPRRQPAPRLSPKAGRRSALAVGTRSGQPYRPKRALIQRVAQRHGTRAATSRSVDHVGCGERGVRTDQSLPPVIRRRRAASVFMDLQELPISDVCGQSNKRPDCRLDHRRTSVELVRVNARARAEPECATLASRRRARRRGA